MVNPNIDAHGISGEEMHADPDFAEDYRNGVYDIPCNACDGTGKMRESDQQRLEEAAADRRLSAAEDGVWEPGIGDYRYGFQRGY